MKQSQFEKEYEKRAQQALEHHVKVIELARSLPTEEFEVFYHQEEENYRRVLKGILSELEQEMEGKQQ